MFSLDTETTGVDHYHGARPFFITTCDDDDNLHYWEWDVDPLTRRPIVPADDLAEVAHFISKESEAIALQNGKFDAAALNILFLSHAIQFKFPWDRMHDTLIAGHLLASNKPHDLTSMALQYLGVDIQPFEIKLANEVKAARRKAKSLFPAWRLAKEGVSEMPSVKGSSNRKEDKPWKNDTWLPRALAKEMELPDDHPWWTVLKDYANADSSVTLPLWKAMKAEIERRGLWEIYLTRLKLIPITHNMERRGVSGNYNNLDKQYTEYKEESERAAIICSGIARVHSRDLGLTDDYELKLPKTGVNNSLMEFCTPLIENHRHTLTIPRSDTGRICMDKNALPYYELQFTELYGQNSWQAIFFRKLREKRKRDKAMGDMDGYRRFAVVIPGFERFFVLHPSLNPTGTVTLRWSSSNPNEQNISKQPGFNMRHCFGPAPGREWWSLDAKNIELRIPAYEAGEREMIDLFERPDDPPYFGSNHLLVCHILHPELFEACLRDGVSFKDRYKATWYQWVKNGNFAVQYGAVEESGTADRAYHVPNAQRRIQARFSNIAALNKKMIAFANKHGYVETIPDMAVNPHRGYPIMCTRSEWGKILPTVPLNYHVQSTAMWWMGKAMIRCQTKLDEWQRLERFDGYMNMQVHDELVFDFPQGKGKEPWKTNLNKIMRIRQEMEKGGDDIGIPTPCSVEYHPQTWSEGMTL